MNTFVKDFIEDNIGLLDIKEYVTFFTAWARESVLQDDPDQDFSDLKDVFVSAGIYDETFSARQEVVLEAVNDVVHSNRISGEEIIHIEDIMNSCTPLLGIDMQTIIRHLEQDYNVDPLKGVCYLQ